MLPKTDQASRLVYKGVRFDIHTLDLPGRHGGPVHREAVAAPDAVVILPLLGDHTVVLIRNERFVVGQTLWELPAGTMEPGEEPRSTAHRELMEEAGYRAERLEPMTTFFPSPGICTEQMHAFLAHDLQHVGQQLDENERIRVEAVALNRSIQMVRDHTICDGKTIATLLYYHAFYMDGS